MVFEELKPLKLKIDSFKGEFHFLSNFYPLEFYYIGNQMFLSAEHAYQSQKARFPRDAQLIAQAATPAMAKRMGQQVLLRKDWEFTKLALMLQIVRRKFDHPVMATLLKDTGDAELIEGNTWGDTYWGVCNGKGQNQLGKILMLVRDELPERSV